MSWPEAGFSGFDEVMGAILKGEGVKVQMPNWSPLKWALTILPLIGIAAVIYMLFSAAGSRPAGALDSYATGTMADFVTIEDAPSQSLNTLTRLDGQTLTLADKRGKVLLVNYWATWCAPCVVEMPQLNALQARYGSDDFEVVTISMDRRMDEAAEFFEANGLDALTLYHGLDLGAVQRLGARGLPITILYDRRGVEIGRMPGEADWASEEAFALIEAAIERY
ncbi:TlpA family protein disulfide reductase [Marinicauda algicola]|nr:TlpA disulfide reductase family protein [Marinicauda algicola]